MEASTQSKVHLTPDPIIPKRRAPFDPGLGPPGPLLAGPDGTGLAVACGSRDSVASTPSAEDAVEVHVHTYREVGRMARAAARMAYLVPWTNEMADLPGRAKTGQHHGAMTPSLFWAGCALCGLHAAR